MRLADIVLGQMARVLDRKPRSMQSTRPPFVYCQRRHSQARGRGITVSAPILAVSSDLSAGADNCRKAARLVMHRKETVRDQ